MKNRSVQLKEVDDTSLCIKKKKYRNGYRFYDEDGNVVEDKSLLKRLRKLIIPPMWTDVHICKWDDGHIQAIGRDAKGRKQYIYHSEWEKKRQEEKFARMVEFGQKLPILREKVLKDIKKKGWTLDRLLSIMVLVLDETGIRIGNKQYADRNGTYGLTTLRRKHMEIEDNSLLFEYKGKSNKNRQVEIDDEELIKLIRNAAQQPGYEIFRYKDGSNGWTSIDSNEVNDYIRGQMGDDFSSKDFRTWVASRYAIELYPQAMEEKSKAPRRKFSNILLRLVADELGNTPTVCKSYYVHPKVMQRIEDQSLPICKYLENDLFSPRHSESEKLLLEVIQG